MQPLIINLAPTGMVPMSSDTPFVPMTPEAIVTTVDRCASLGASIVHLHARGFDERPTTDPNIIAKIIAGIRESHPQLIITTTTSGRLVSDIKERASSLFLEGHLKPDMASLTLGSMNFSRDASVNAPDTIMRLAEIMLERGIKPELEVFDLGMLNFAKILIDKGLLQPPYYFNILLGNPSTAQASLLHIAAIVNELPNGSIWSLAGIGRFQRQANALGVVIADGVRVGLEDNLWFDDDRKQLATNEDLVGRIVAQANALGRRIATPLELRTRLGLGSPY